jgi:hypothetical protein
MLDDSVPAARPKRHYRRWVLAAVLGTAVIIAAAFYAPLPFTLTLWDVPLSGTVLNTRQRVADRLVSTHRLVGMSRPEVIRLLGEPTDTDKFRDHSLVYVLGPERGFISIDHEWLLVDMGASNSVESVVVVRD